MIEDSEGYKHLKAAILADVNSGRSEEERLKKLEFAVDRARHYEERIGVSAADVLTAWESRRDFWYMNYYQDAQMPLIQGNAVRVFDTADDLLAAIGGDGFRCPHCKGVTRNPYRCDSGIKLPLINSRGVAEACNWSVYGLFGALGKVVFVFVKDQLKGEGIFKPIAWETAEQPAAASGKP